LAVFTLDFDGSGTLLVLLLRFDAVQSVFDAVENRADQTFEQEAFQVRVRDLLRGLRRFFVAGFGQLASRVDEFLAFKRGFEGVLGTVAARVLTALGLVVGPGAEFEDRPRPVNKRIGGAPGYESPRRWRREPDCPGRSMR